MATPIIAPDIKVAASQPIQKISISLFILV